MKQKPYTEVLLSLKSLYRGDCTFLFVLCLEKQCKAACNLLFHFEKHQEEQTYSTGAETLFAPKKNFIYCRKSQK
jgi:hypothetical protein